MSVSVTLKSYFYEVLIPSSQKNTSSPIEDILHHVSISFMKKLALYKCFNPRTHTGCDLLGKVLTTRLYSFQSTHPHGVRLSLYQLKKVLEEFQSTHPHGVRQSQALTPHAWHRFQSTHPHGVRRIPRPHRPYKTRFQSTHPHGVRRDSFGGAFNDIAVSIHAPTRGATRGRISGIHVHYTFQSTHPHGVRLYRSGYFGMPTLMFQSTHPHGVRLCRGGGSTKSCGFNPRTHTGCDICRRLLHQGRGGVSIHAPTRGATVCKVTYYKSIN